MSVIGTSSSRDVEPVSVTLGRSLVAVESCSTSAAGHVPPWAVPGGSRAAPGRAQRFDAVRSGVALSAPPLVLAHGATRTVARDGRACPPQLTDAHTSFGHQVRGVPTTCRLPEESAREFHAVRFLKPCAAVPALSIGLRIRTWSGGAMEEFGSAGGEKGAALATGSIA